MKKIALIALAFVTLQATAQDKKSKDGHKKERTEKRANFTPEEMATLQTKKMTLHLDLTESQQKQIHAITLEKATARKAKMEARKNKKGDAKREKPSNEDKLKRENERLDAQIAHKAQMKSILNADQYEKWERGLAKRGKKGKKGHKGEKGKEGKKGCKGDKSCEGTKEKKED